MGIPFSSLSSEQRRRIGMEIPSRSARAKRHTGTVAQRKAAMVERHKYALELFHCDVLPEGVSVKPTSGKMSGWEKRFWEDCVVLSNIGVVESMAFELVRFDLGGGVSYAPDVIIRYAAPRKIRIVEIKSKLRRRIAFFKMAKAKYSQFDWSIMELVNGSWKPMKVYGQSPARGAEVGK
jgi:hypothetical protein